MNGSRQDKKELMPCTHYHKGDRLGGVAQWYSAFVAYLRY